MHHQFQPNISKNFLVWYLFLLALSLLYLVFLFLCYTILAVALFSSCIQISNISYISAKNLPEIGAEIWDAWAKICQKFEQRFGTLERKSVRNSSRGQGPLNFWVEVREEFLEESESESECECESERGRELRSLLRNYLIHPIYTCWSKCRCHTTGTNRLRNRNVATGMQQECNRRCAGGHPV